MDLLPPPTRSDPGPLSSPPHTASDAAPDRPKVEVIAGFTFIEWKERVELDADFESLVAHHYTGKPLPFALGARNARLFVPPREA
jgi:hypothetical protein